MITFFIASRMVAISIVLLVASCGTEVGRVPFAAEGAKSVVMPLDAGEVAFWTEIDLKYAGSTALNYRVDLVQGGAVVAVAQCEALGPMNVKTGWVEWELGASHMRKGNGRMTCSAQLPKSGPTLVRATLGFDPPPSSVRLRKADLVVKQ